MSDIDYEKIAEEVANKLDDRRSVDEEKHAKHHRYIDNQLQQAEERAQIIRDLKKKVFIGISFGFLIGIWQLFEYWFEHVVKGAPHG